MQATATSFNPSDIVSVINNEPRTTSLKVAETFGKLHKDVLRKIALLDCSTNFTERNFALCHKNNDLQNGKPQPYYEMTKDGFMFLVMGFTGKQAAAIKEAYINAFNWLAAKLQSQILAGRLPAISHSGGPLVFQGVPVMGTAQISQFFHCDRGLIKLNAEHHPSRFVAGVHYFKLSGDILQRFALDNLHTGLIGRRHGREWLIWSYEGVSEHARLLPDRYSADWQARWQRYADGHGLSVIDATPVPVIEPAPLVEPAPAPPVQIIRQLDSQSLQAALLGLQVAMDFMHNHVKPTASAIERLIITTDLDAAGLCRILFERSDEMHNHLDCIREDLELKAAPRRRGLS